MLPRDLDSLRRSKRNNLTLTFKDMEKTQVKSLAGWVVALLVAAFGVGASVSALGGDKGAIEVCNNCTVHISMGGLIGSGEELGAATPNRIPHGYMDTSDGYYVDGVAVINGSGQSYNMVNAGPVFTTTTNVETTGVLTQSDLSSYNFIEVSPGSASGMTYTLPNSSTLTTFLPSAGDRKRIMIRNTTTTAAVKVNLLAAPGMFIEYASGTRAIMNSSTVAAEFIRRSNTDVSVMVVPFGG